jgi:hypothetical protein
MAYPVALSVPLNDCQPCSAPRTVDAEQIMILLDELVKMAEDLSGYASSRLSSLTHSEPPSVGAGKPCLESLSPLFNEYRERILNAQDAVKRTRYSIERVEV